MYPAAASAASAGLVADINVVTYPVLNHHNELLIYGQLLLPAVHLMS